MEATSCSRQSFRNGERKSSSTFARCQMVGTQQRNGLLKLIWGKVDKKPKIFQDLTWALYPLLQVF